MDILEQNQTNEQQTNTQGQTTSPAVPPSTWLITAILTTIFCCMPFGLAGVVYAARVEPYSWPANIPRPRWQAGTPRNGH